uniref:hypothetical protein n=1 Tax=Alistipes sp. TaxID=1872444 RepID=UPI00307CA7C6
RDDCRMTIYNRDLFCEQNIHRLGFFWIVIVIWIIIDSIWLFETDFLIALIIGSLFVYLHWHLIRHIRFVPGPMQKIMYGIYILWLGPFISQWILPVIYLLPYIIYLCITAVTVVFNLIFDGAFTPSLPKKFDLDNGDTVQTKTGLFGEKTYEGKSGRKYHTNDNNFFQ